jgi:glucose-6-phosphate 1-dehydrogenase
MEPPTSFGAEDLAAAREAVIGAFRPLEPDDVVLGQFEGYRDIDGVADDSRTETFVAARLWVDTERWRGVPFLLRTGKQLAASRQQVSLVFRRPDAPVHELPALGNVLTFDLAGDVARCQGTRTRPDAQHGAHCAAAEDSARSASTAALRPADPRRAAW